MWALPMASPLQVVGIVPCSLLGSLTAKLAWTSPFQAVLTSFCEFHLVTGYSAIYKLKIMQLISLLAHLFFFFHLLTQQI